MTVGKKHSEETKRKMSESRTGIPHPHKGVIPTKETIEKRRMQMLGKVCSEETRRKISLSNTGFVRSEEILEKMRSAQKGHLCSEETKQKIRESNLGKKRSDFVHHHTKYEEIHGKDVVVILTRSEHTALHSRLRREGKCNIDPKELRTISDSANKRRTKPERRVMK